MKYKKRFIVAILMVTSIYMASAMAGSGEGVEPIGGVTGGTKNQPLAGGPHQILI